MHSLIKSICAITLLLTFCSCNKQLNQKPISEISYSDFWQTAGDAKAANAAMYHSIQNTFSPCFIDWGDARSDNFTDAGTGEAQIGVSFNALNSLTNEADWNNLYTTISQANLAIKYLPTITDLNLTSLQRNHYLAQAYATRAFMYFWGIRVWGDLPVRLKPYENVDSVPNIARVNKDSILNFVIIPDLLQAKTLVDKSSKSPFQISYGAILSMLSEVYLWQHNYNNVLLYTDTLIAMNRYKLQDTLTYKNVFTLGTTSENIWTLNWNYLQDGINQLGKKIGSNGNTSQFIIDAGLLLKWEKNTKDIRRSLNYDTTSAILYPSGTLLVPTVNLKYAAVDITTGLATAPTRTQNDYKLPFYRWADILLMRAEAKNYTGDTASAFKLLYQVRNRANAGNINPVAYNSFSSSEDVENAILDERQLEFFAEGKRWFDLVRTNRVITTMDQLVKKRQSDKGFDPVGFSDSRKILWPIYRTELINDPLLVQNPPYSY